MLKTTASWLAKICYGVLLPGYLLWVMLVTHYTNTEQRIVEQNYDRMSQMLEPFELNHSDHVFFHSVLQTNLEQADLDTNPEIELRRALTSLRSAFSGGIRFVVWNADGKISNELSDEKSFRYILNTMYTTIHQLNEAFVEKFVENAISIPEIKERIALLRGYFGEYLTQAELFEPLKQGHLGRAIISSPDPEKRMLWFYPGTNFSIICLINASLLQNHAGPKLMINKFNHLSPGAKLGYLKNITYEHYGLPENTAEAAELQLAAIKFHSYAHSRQRTQSFLAVFSHVSVDLTAVCYMPYKPEPASARALSTIISLFKWLIISVFILYCAKLARDQHGLSVAGRLKLLFLFANALPIIVMLAIGYEFFYERTSYLISRAHTESISLAREIDVSYPILAKEMGQKINRFIEKNNATYGSEKWPDQALIELREFIVALQPNDAWIIEPETSSILHALGQRTDDSLINQYFNLALMFFNTQNSDQTAIDEKGLLQGARSTDQALRRTLSDMNKLVLFREADVERMLFTKFLGDSSTYSNWGVFATSWSRSRFMRIFLPELLKKNVEKARPRIILAMDTKTEEFIGNDQQIEPSIVRLMRHAVTRKLVLHEGVMYNGARYLFTAIAANETPDIVIAALYPQDLTNQEIWKLKIAIAIAGLLMAFALLKIINLFAGKLIAPINELNAGFNQMAAQNYDYSVSHRSDDELGDLSTAFNGTMTGLKELAVGTAVQVGLLPTGQFNQRNVSLFAHSSFMSKMGGDYFDYYPVNDKEMLIFFGDVAGHGIPAAMIMAMMKAVVAGAIRQGNTSPAQVLAAASPVFEFLKQKKWRRMMTAQCMHLNTETGTFKLANAGQCYPVLIKSHGQNISYCKSNGMPLGNRLRKPYDESEWQLESGDVLVLYTDGIIEATNSSGDVFDFAGFERLLKNHWNTNLEAYWQDIFQGYSNWATEQDDDITMLMLRFDKNEK